MSDIYFLVSFFTGNSQALQYVQDNSSPRARATSSFDNPAYVGEVEDTLADYVIIRDDKSEQSAAYVAERKDQSAAYAEEREDQSAAYAGERDGQSAACAGESEDQSEAQDGKQEDQSTACDEGDGRPPKDSLQYSQNVLFL
jgi:hypothetical protein